MLEQSTHPALNKAMDSPCRDRLMQERLDKIKAELISSVCSAYNTKLNGKSLSRQACGLSNHLLCWLAIVETEPLPRDPTESVITGSIWNAFIPPKRSWSPVSIAPKQEASKYSRFSSTRFKGRTLYVGVVPLLLRWCMKWKYTLRWVKAI